MSKPIYKHKGGDILKDGHTMFLEDAVKDLKAQQATIAKLEAEIECLQSNYEAVKRDAHNFNLMQAELKAEVARLKAENEWVSVEDRLPEAMQGNKVLGFGNGYSFECEFDEGFWCNIGGEEMTHWKPITPPKGE